MSFKNLLSPIKIGSMAVKNRFVIPAMGTNYANPDGTISQKFIDYHAARAKGGYGLNITEVTAIDPIGNAILFEPGIYDDRFIPGLKALTDAVHANGGKIAVQLHHAGRQTNSFYVKNQPVSASPIECPANKEIPRELTTQEVYELIEKFGDGAVRAKKAGFDAVEVHGAHGYLISQFMSAYSNKRMDEFGGSLEARMKFPVEIIKNIRKKVGDDYPIIFRINGEDRIPGGTEVKEAIAQAKIMEKAGVDALNVSVGVYGCTHWIIAPSAAAPGFNLPAAAQIKKAVSIPVITVGRINSPNLAETAIATEMTDMVALGRESIADPEFPNKVAAGALDEISPCIACLQGCSGYVFNPEKLQVSCMVNPFVGREGELKIEPTEKPKKIMIVGGGPAGLETAWIAAKRGHNVTLYEKDEKLGGQFRIGAIPPMKQDILSALKYFIKMCEKYGVDMKLNTEVTVEMIKAEKPDAVILSTGGVPLILKINGIDNPKVVNAIDVLEGKQVVGNNVLIVGGGIVGVETADFLGEHGHRVSIIDMLPEVGMGVEPSVKYFLNQRLTDYGVKAITNAKVKEFLEDGIIYEQNGTEATINGFDTIVLAMGAKAYNPLEEAIKDLVPEVHVIGDAVKARKAIDAIAEAAEIEVRI